MACVPIKRTGWLAALLWTTLSLVGMARGSDPLQRILLLEDRRQAGRELSKLTRDARPEVRRRAVEALGRIQDALSIPTLEARTTDSDPQVRRTTYFALGQMSNPAAEPALLRAWTTERDPHLCTVMVEAVGKCATPRGLQVLSDALTDRDPEVRADAAVALGNSVYWTQRDHHRREVVSNRTLERLRRLTSDPSPRARWGALYALYRLKAHAPLQECLRDADSTVRAYAAKAAGAAGDTSVCRTLLDLLEHDPDWKVRVEAAGALGKLKVPGAGVAFGDVIWGPNVHVAIAACRALGPFCGDAFLEGPPAPGRRGRNIPYLPPSVRPEALIGVIRILLNSGTQGVMTLAAHSDDWRFRQGAATALGLVPNQALLTELLADPDARVRAEAVSSLEHADRSWSDPLLLSALEDKDDVVAASAAEILGGRHEKAAAMPIQAWIERLRTSDRGESLVSFIQALGKIDPHAARPLLRQCLTHVDPTVRQAAGAILKVPVSPGDPDAVPLALGQSVEGQPVAVVHTNRGDFRMRLFLSDSPNTVISFEHLARRGFYEGLTFHRVVPDFVVQGGDPRGDGSGGPGYLIRDEINEHHYGRGSVGMALAGKDTGGSQWFITHSPQPHLDGHYTCFGQVESGMAVVDSLQQGDRMLSIDIR